MLDNSKVFNAASNSFETSAHDTGTSVIALIGNPYTDLAAYGIDLHGCSIRYLRSSNKAGNTITGRFNISGREETAGATTYQALITFLVKKHKEHRSYFAECQQRKRKRNYASWLARHPEFTLYNCNGIFM